MTDKQMKMHELQTIGMQNSKGITECVVDKDADDALCTCALGSQMLGFLIQEGESAPEYTYQSWRYNQEFFEFYDTLDWDNVHQALDWLCETRPRLKLIKRHIKAVRVTDATSYWELNTFTQLNDFEINADGVYIIRDNARRLLVLALLRWLDI